MLYLSNGIGESTGDTLVTTKPLQTAGVVWYVNSATGTDGASPAGKDREKPLATMAQAQTNASNGDIVVLQDGHTETYTAALTISKSLCIVGAGSASGVPTANFTINAAANGVFLISANNVQLRNIKFKAAAQSDTGGGVGNCEGKVCLSGTDTLIYGCYFEQSGNDQFPGIFVNGAASRFRIVNTTIISTATAAATRPTYGIFYTTSHTDTEMDGLVLSDGTVGFSTAALDGTAAALTRLRAQNVSLLLGAKFKVHASTTGWVAVTTSTGGAQVSW